MATNKIPFDNTTNYDDVYRIVKLMRGDIGANEVTKLYNGGILVWEKNGGN